MPIDKRSVVATFTVDEIVTATIGKVKNVDLTKIKSDEAQRVIDNAVLRTLSKKGVN